MKGREGSEQKYDKLGIIILSCGEADNDMENLSFLFASAKKT